MFIAEMNNPLHITIISDDKSGLAEIMSGYLRFYGNHNISISLKTETTVIHPLAEQVLKEDGIDAWGAHAVIPKSHQQLKVYLNTKHSDNNSVSSHRHYHFEDPLQFDAYDKILATFRKTREAIKKATIELVGEIVVQKD
ncbi:MAG: hypothetical protein WBP43_06270 [Chitinophagales bacterium]